MREHEVPTHVQAEDRVLLGFTFPQVVAVMAVCALSYGAYHYAPVGPSEVRMALAVLFGLVGIAMIVGKIGGRRLPLVAADLLKYRLGARRYAGQIAQLVRSEPPAPAQPVQTGPGPLSLMAKRVGRGLRRLRKKTRQGKERRNGRMRWFGKRRGKDGGSGQRNDHRAETLKIRRRKPRMGWMAVVAVVLVAAASRSPRRPWPTTTGGTRSTSRSRSPSPDGGYSSRACHRLRRPRRRHIPCRNRPGHPGAGLRRAAGELAALLGVGVPGRGGAGRLLAPPARTRAVLHRLVGGHPRPGRGADLQARADPVPAARSRGGELCDLRMTSLGWTPGAVSGVIESECVTHTEHPVELQTVAGHQSVTETALLDAQVTAVTGTVAAAAGASQASVSFVPNGETQLPPGRWAMGAAIHAVTVDASLEASLRIPMPPLTQLTHHPERVEHVTKTVHLHRPGDSDSDSDTATVTCDDGATSSATASAYAYVPSATIAKEVTVDVLHKEHVRAEVVERSPITRTRAESLTLASAVGSDAPFEVLVLPEPEPEEPPAEQEPANDLRRWFEALGWEWPW